MVLLRAAQTQQIKGTASDIDNGSDPAGEKDTKNITDDHNVLHHNEEGYYAAVDIGTTTLSIEIYNQDGRYVGGCADNNAQGKLGSDVMMRLMHVSEGRQDILCRLIRDQIYHLLGKLLTDIVNMTGRTGSIGAVSTVDIADGTGRVNTAGLPDGTGRVNTADLPDGVSDTEAVLAANLRKITVVGNTVMCHLFLDRDLTGLQGAPFCPDYEGSCQVWGKDLGWSACPEVEVTVLPGIAAHVGADAAAVLMAEQLWQEDRIQLAVDLGTNAEILLNNRGRIWVCSAAAGPAFEGKGISCGCRGRAGAVSGVKLNRANGNILLTVMPDSATGKLLPNGICGSGLVDLIAELLENRLLQPDGYLLTQSEAIEHGICDALVQRLGEENGDRYFLLYDPLADKMMGADGQQAKRLYVTQQDIRNFQLAKSAIQTGIALLCHQAGLDVAQIEDCRIAGVFGTFLHPDHARASGLLPDLPPDRIHFVGNAAGRGAAQALFDAGWIAQSEKRIQGIHHVELAEQEEFQSVFLKNMTLGH